MIRAEGAAAAGEALYATAAALRQAMEDAVGTQAEKLQEEAKRRCPADSASLRDSIRAEVRTWGNAVLASIGSDLDYAAMVELGTLNMPPAPFLAPAMEARGSAVINRIRLAVRGAVEGERG